MKLAQNRCIAIESLTTFKVEVEADGKVTKITVTLPFFEPAEQFPKGKESVATYNARIFLINTILTKAVTFDLTGKLPLMSDVFIQGVSLSEQLVTRGFAKLKKDCNVQSLCDLEKKAVEKKLGVWGPDGLTAKNIPELGEHNMEQLIPQFSNSRTPIKLFVERVLGLKLFVLCVDYNILAVVYFSELKIPRIGGVDPKTGWTQVEGFLNDVALHRVLGFVFKKEDVYKGEVSLYGSLTVNDINLRDQLLAKGLAELSSTAKTFLSKQEYEQSTKFQQHARRDHKGLYGLGSKGDKFREKGDLEQPPSKLTTKSSATNSAGGGNKFKQYETWIKEQRRINTLVRNPIQQLKEIIGQLTWDRKEELSDNKIKRLKILSQVFTVLMQNRTSKYLVQLKEYMKATCLLLTNLMDRIASRLQIADQMKLINMLFRGLIFCLNEIKENQQFRKEEFVQAELEKIVRHVFKLIFVGNSVMHQKLFGKRNDLHLQNFEFSALDYSGISSMSEISESEDTVRPTKEDNKKRIQQANLKIRISSSLLLSLMFKVVPALLEIHWELCVKSNAFSEEFNEHIRELQIKYSGQNISTKERDNILNMMKINFGEHSLLCMLIFEESAKVKANILESIGLMMTTFQGRKILPSLDINLLEKEQKKTSSFVPKSLLIFWAYKNILYTLLFCLYHEKNIDIIHSLLKTVTLLVQHTALLQKISFDHGLNILIENFLLPMLKFPAENVQFGNLQLSVIRCLTAIVSSDYIWKELYIQWFEVDSKQNINRLLISVLKGRLLKEQITPLDEAIVDQINLYMAKLAANYFPALVKENSEKESVWSVMSCLFKSRSSSSFGKVIEQLCRRACPLKDEEEEHQKQSDEQRLPQFQSKFNGQFVEQYLPGWLEKHEIFDNPQQIIDILDILTCLNNSTLQRQSYGRVRSFILFIFNRLSLDKPIQEEISQSKGQYQFSEMTKSQEFKNNVLVKVSYVKLIGHMSFCEIFHSGQIMASVFNNLHIILKAVKGVNTLIRCSWALSNWCSVPNFLQVFDRDQLNETFEYLLEFARSDKEKIASNGTRGIGMFIKNLPKMSAETVISMSEVQKVMTNNINHKSPKVSWNCSVALRNILKSPNSAICVKLFQENQFVQSLLHNFSRSNYKLQIQTLETLRCIDGEMTIKYANHIVQSLTDILEETLRHLTQYSFGEFKYINLLRKELIRYYIELVPDMTDEAVLKLAQNNSLSLFIESLYYLLTERSSGKEYSKSKELLDRGNQAGQEVQKQIFNVKNNQKFHDELEIPVKQSEYRRISLSIDSPDHDFFSKLKKMSSRIVILLEKSDAKVSLLITDAFQQLSDMKIADKSIELNLLEL